jgi:hypothetical protein
LFRFFSQAQKRVFNFHLLPQTIIVFDSRSLLLHIVLHFNSFFWFPSLPLHTGAGEVFVWDFAARVPSSTLLEWEVERARNQGCVTLSTLNHLEVLKINTEKMRNEKRLRLVDVFLHLTLIYSSQHLASYV